MSSALPSPPLQVPVAETCQPAALVSSPQPTHHPSCSGLTQEEGTLQGPHGRCRHVMGGSPRVTARGTHRHWGAGRAWMPSSPPMTIPGPSPAALEGLGGSGIPPFLRLEPSSNNGEEGPRPW